MKYRLYRRLSPSLILLCSVLTAQIAHAEDIDRDVLDYQNKLDRVQKSIEKVKNHLKSTRYKRSSVVTNLHKLEKQISDNSRNLKKTDTKIRQLDQHISNIKKELVQLDTKLGHHRRILADQIRASYAIGPTSEIKLLLNQEDASSVGRLNVYFDYLNRARQHHIKEFSKAIQQRRDRQQELNTALGQQQSNQEDYRAQKKKLNQQRRERNKLLATLDIEIKNQELTLNDLEDSRNRIENLLMSLGELLADIPPGPDGTADFASLKGRLPWPVRGDFIARFGQTKEQASLRWNGVLISGGYGVPVRAVSRGRVAFSDWLQGFGFITILDHGNGFMTLYGHNESLFKSPGDWVEAGETIATVGDSGGHSRPALYFEIRERGKPVNPDSWCSSTIAHNG